MTAFEKRDNTLNRQITDTEKYTETGRKLCSLIGAAALDSAVPSAEEIDLQTALRIARFHNILPIAYYALKEARCSGELMAQAEKSAGNMAFKQIKLGIMEDELSRAFSDAGIPHYILKGSRLQKYYSEKTVRTSTDTDFYLDEKFASRAKEIMESFGFALSSFNAHSKTYDFKKEPRYNVEIHCELEDTEKPAELEFLKTLLENPIRNDGSLLSFNEEDLYLHTFFHLYKHFTHSGAGLKMFLDIYVLNRRLSLDMDSINKRLEAIHLDRFHQTVLRECSVLFEGAQADEITDYLTQKIILEGAFGIRGEGLNRNRIIMSENPSKTKKRLIIEDMGASRENMRRKYPVLEKAPYLLPFCHVHRAVKGIITKPELVRSVWRNIGSMSGKKIASQKKTLSSVGLNPDSDKH